MLKMVYPYYIMHNNSKIQAEYIYIRFGLGIYSPHIYILTDLKACAQSRANKYIYIYIYIYVYASMYKLESGCARLNIA